MSFTDAFPVGRVPVLAPVVFDKEGWPSVVGEYANKEGQWLREYPSPAINAHDQSLTRKTSIGKHTFSESRLSNCWEWNHNPDNSKWRIQDEELILESATVTHSLPLASNTLTIRTVGPGSIATCALDISMMKEGDRCGISIFKDESAYIGVHREGSQTNLVYVDDIRVGPEAASVGFMNGRPAALDWKLLSAGTVSAMTSLQSPKVWLRVKADLRAFYCGPAIDEDREAFFEYSHDGTNFTRLGPGFMLTKSSLGFIGYRFALFNFATKDLGGAIRVSYCTIEAWDPKS